MSALLTAGGASGAAGGDLSGTYPNPTVLQIDAVAVATVTTGAAAGATAVQPGGAGTVAADTGWTANASVGDKTVSVADYTSADIAAMDGFSAIYSNVGAALNTISSRVSELTKKVQAAQTALAAALRPNA